MCWKNGLDINAPAIECSSEYWGENSSRALPQSAPAFVRLWLRPPCLPSSGFRDLEMGNAAWEMLEPRGYSTHQGFPCQLHISLFLALKSLAMHFRMAVKPVG